MLHKNSNIGLSYYDHMNNSALDEEKDEILVEYLINLTLNKQ